MLSPEACDAIGETRPDDLRLFPMFETDLAKRA